MWKIILLVHLLTMNCTYSYEGQEYVCFGLEILSAVNFPFLNVGQVFQSVHNNFIITPDENSVKKMSEIHTSLIEMKEQIGELGDKIDDTEESMNVNNALNTRLNDLNAIVRNIKVLNQDSENYLQRWNKYDNITKLEFARKNRARDFFSEIYHLIEDPIIDENNNYNLLKLLALSMQRKGAKFFTSNRKFSPQLMLRSYFEKILTEQMKAYVMRTFSYYIEKLYDHRNVSAEIEDYEKRSIAQITNEYKTLRASMMNMSRDFWRSDPQIHEENVTYIEAVGLVSRNFIICGARQADKVQPTVHDYNVFKCKELNHRYNKEDQALDLKTIDVSLYLDFSICFSKQNPRIYNGFSYEPPFSFLYGITNFGNFSECNSLNFSKVIGRFVFGGRSLSDGNFDIREVQSNVAANKVITGIRFVKKNRIIRIQIQEGIVRKYGLINQKTVSWRLLDNLNITNGVRGEDFHQMKHYIDHLTSNIFKNTIIDQTEIEFADYDLPKNEVLTSVQFFVQEGRLKLSVKGSKYDFQTGKISETDTTTFKNKNHSNVELELYEPDLPTRSKQSLPLSNPTQFIKMTHSGVTKDDGQTTVPFFDAQDVVTKTPCPLQGLGLFLKGEKGFGGFLTFKIKTFDYAMIPMAAINKTN